jgi:hypothetical protein
MRFSKVSLTKKGVKLFSTRTTGSGTTEEKNLRAPQEPPMQSFVDALQAFKPLVIAVLKGAVKIEPEAMTITTLNLSEDKNHLRGLIVTAVVPLPQAYGKPLVINTPLIREGGENASEDAFVLEDHHMEMIRVVEAEGTAFYKGNRQQLELPIKQESANAKDVGERMAAASIDSTRKGGKKGRIAGQIGKPGPLTTPRLRQLLLMVERDVPEEAIDKWTSSERDAAQRWAEIRQKELAGNLADAKVPREPKCLIADAVKTLADAWSADKPPRAEAVAPVGLEGKNGRRPHVQQ